MRLNYNMTIDVDVNPGVLLPSSDSDTGRVPDSRPPDRVKVARAREIQTSKYFAADPLLSLHLISVVLSAALVAEFSTSMSRLDPRNCVSSLMDATSWFFMA